MLQWDTLLTQIKQIKIERNWKQGILKSKLCFFISRIQEYECTDLSLFLPAVSKQHKNKIVGQLWFLITCSTCAPTVARKALNRENI